MKNLTLDDIKKYQDTRDTIIDKGYEMIKYKKDNDLNFANQLSNSWSISDFEIDENDINFNVYESWAYGGYDNTNVSFPLELLFDDNWEETLKSQYEKSNAEYLKNKAEQEERQRLAEIKKAKETIKKLTK